MSNPIVEKMMPNPNNGLPSAHDIAIADIQSIPRLEAKSLIDDLLARKAFGLEKYKVPLQPHNGTDQGMQALQEMCDAIPYLAAKLYEIHKDASLEIETLWMDVYVSQIETAKKLKILMGMEKNDDKNAN